MKLDCAFLLDAPNEGGSASWVQVAKTGKFNDPRYGEFTITAKDFAKWIQNFDASVGRGEVGLPVDVDHSPEKRGDTEAVGWVKQLERREDELWAHVLWNAAGQDLIKDQRYAYISPSYNPSFKDEQGKQHGTTMVGIALTNRPFLKMATVNLSSYQFARREGDADDDVTVDLGVTGGQIGTATNAMDIDMDQGFCDECLPHMLDVSDAYRQKHATVVKKIDGKTKHMFPIAPGDKVHAVAALRLLPKAIAAGHITTSEAASIRSKAHSVLGTQDKQHSAYSPLREMELAQVLTAMKLTRADLGVAEDAEDAVVLEALAKYEKPAPTPEPPAGSVTLTQEQVTQMTSDAAAGRAASEELRVNKFEGAFEVALSQGRLTPAQKDTFRTLYDQQSEATLKLMTELQPVINLEPSGHGQEPTNLPAAARVLAGVYRDELTGMPSDPAGLKILARADELIKTGVAADVAMDQAINEAP